MAQCWSFDDYSLIWDTSRRKVWFVRLSVCQPKWLKYDHIHSAHQYCSSFCVNTCAIVDWKANTAHMWATMSTHQYSAVCFVILLSDSKNCSVYCAVLTMWRYAWIGEFPTFLLDDRYGAATYLEIFKIWPPRLCAQTEAILLFFWYYRQMALMSHEMPPKSYLQIFSCKTSNKCCILFTLSRQKTIVFWRHLQSNLQTQSQFTRAIWMTTFLG